MLMRSFSYFELASLHSYVLSVALLAINSSVKKRPDIAVKAFANWLNNHLFGAGTQSHIHTPGREGGQRRERELTSDIGRLGNAGGPAKEYRDYMGASEFLLSAFF